ncbi:MAG: hypothetical protein RSB55_06085 [Oscillospiraceae bacterium]
MYNRYLPGDGAYQRIVMEDAPPSRNPQPAPTSVSGSSAPGANFLGGVTDFLGGLFKGLDLGDLDSGDILLVLIILFLFLEGDNLELVISLGLLLLLGLGDKKEPSGEA